MSKEQIASKGFLKLTAKKTGPDIYHNFLFDQSMKLKLGLLVTDLCQPFEISGDLCTKIFNSCLQKQPLELFFRRATSLKKRLWHRCFLVNFAKFWRTSFCRGPPGDCFWTDHFLKLFKANVFGEGNEVYQEYGSSKDVLKQDSQ